MVLILHMLISPFGTVSATANPVNSETSYETEKISIYYNVDSTWQDGFNANITIENKSNEPFEDWYLKFSFQNIITNIRNGAVINTDSSTYTIANAG